MVITIIGSIIPINIECIRTYYLRHEGNFSFRYALTNCIAFISTPSIDPGRRYVPLTLFIKDTEADRGELFHRNILVPTIFIAFISIRELR